MTIINLGTVAHECREICKSNLLKYRQVGLEHLDSESITLKRWDEPKESTFTKMFHSGQILFGRRNVYLKKAAVATFDGICSGDITVLEALPGKIYSPFLPFVIQNDAFFDYADRKATGTMSRRIKWNLIQKYEFNLPSLEEQKHLAEIFWAIENTKLAYNKLLLLIDDLVKSQFIEMFGDPVILDKKWQIKTINDVTTVQLGKMLNAKNQTGKNQYYYLANRNVKWFSFDFDDLKKMDFDMSERKKLELQDGDLLVCEGGEIGRCAIWHNEIKDCYIQNAVYRLRCNKDITPIFLAYLLYYHAQKNSFSDVIGSNVTISHFPSDQLKMMQIIIPPIKLQMEFVSFVNQTDKLKFELKKAISDLDVMYKKLLSESLN